MIMMMMMQAEDNFRLVHQSSLVVPPAETFGVSMRNGRRSENFAHQYLKYLEGYLTCLKILWHGTSGFTFHPKEGMLRIFVALINPLPRPGLNPRLLGPKASTLTTTQPGQVDGGEWSASRPGRPLATGKGLPGTHWTRGCVGLRAGLDTEATGKILSPLPGIEFRSPGRPARSQYTDWATSAPLVEWGQEILE
jgi:hypothetical protein